MTAIAAAACFSPRVSGVTAAVVDAAAAAAVLEGFDDNAADGCKAVDVADSLKDICVAVFQRVLCIIISNVSKLVGGLGKSKKCFFFFCSIREEEFLVYSLLCLCLSMFNLMSSGV